MSLNYVEGRMVVKVWMQSKNFHKFEGGPTIRIERQYNNLNKRHTEPVNAIVVSAKGIPAGSEILIHHQATTDTYRIFNHDQLSGEEIGSENRYYSIPEEQAFFWRIDNGKWQPVGGYTPALRVFKPYTGMLIGVEPIQVKDTLYITAGPLFGYVVHTLKASDYEIIFQDSDNRENRIIRCRHYENDHDSEEIQAINHELTKKVKTGKLLVGIDKTSAKPLNELAHA